MTARDPACGMTVDDKTATHRSVYHGEVYYFCSQGCKVAFDKEPEKYAAQDKSASKE